MSQLNADEIKGQTFRGSLFGFNKSEVRGFLAAVSKQSRELNSQLEALQKEVNDWRAREKAMFELTAGAQAEAQAIRENAKKEAEKLLLETEEKVTSIRSKTETWLEEVIAKVEETQRQKQNFLTAFRSALDSHYALIENEEEEVEPLTAKLSGVLRAEAETTPLLG